MSITEERVTTPVAAAPKPAKHKPSQIEKRTQRRLTLTGLGFISPFLIGFAIFTLYPLLMTLYYSFTAFTLFNKPRWIGLNNYRQLTHDSQFTQALLNTIVFAAMAVPLSIFIAASLAMLLHRRMRGRTIYRTIIFAPSVLPAAAVAAIWIWILNPQFGLLNAGLHAFGVPTVPWLSSPGRRSRCC